MLKIARVYQNDPAVILLQRPYAILLVTDGEGTVSVGENRVTLHPGRVLLLRTELKASLEVGTLIGHLVEFQKVLIELYMLQNINLRNKGLFDIAVPLPFVDIDSHSQYFLMNLLCQLTDEIKLASHCKIFQPYLFLLFWHLNRKIAELNIKPIEHQRITEKFMLLLEVHYITERNASFYAEQIGISPRKLRYALDKMTGKTFLDYWQERIFLEADLMLHDREIPLKEIAYALGYSGQSHFTRKYAVYKGMPPGMYRKELT